VANEFLSQYLFMIYLTALTVIQTIYRWTIGRLMNDELEWLWKEAFLVHLPGRTEKKEEKPLSGWSVSSLNSNISPPKYVFEALPFEPIRLAILISDCVLMCNINMIRCRYFLILTTFIYSTIKKNCTKASCHDVFCIFEVFDNILYISHHLMRLYMFLVGMCTPVSEPSI
jgi:hypothetical protein